MNRRGLLAVALPLLLGGVAAGCRKTTVEPARGNVAVSASALGGDFSDAACLAYYVDVFAVVGSELKPLTQLRLTPNREDGTSATAVLELAPGSYVFSGTAALWNDPVACPPPDPGTPPADSLGPCQGSMVQVSAPGTDSSGNPVVTEKPRAEIICLFNRGPENVGGVVVNTTTEIQHLSCEASDTSLRNGRHLVSLGGFWLDPAAPAPHPATFSAATRVPPDLHLYEHVLGGDGKTHAEAYSYIVENTTFPEVSFALWVFNQPPGAPPTPTAFWGRNLVTASYASGGCRFVACPAEAPGGSLQICQECVERGARCAVDPAVIAYNLEVIDQTPKESVSALVFDDPRLAQQFAYYLVRGAERDGRVNLVIKILYQLDFGLTPLRARGVAPDSYEVVLLSTANRRLYTITCAVSSNAAVVPGCTSPDGIVQPAGP
jgi:hypothetical protein